ncbi:MAG: M23 family metallopeptidase [Clostridia bacterium]|nr:M23 family metallopeptidase [Clostridia bacterium]
MKIFLLKVKYFIKRNIYPITVSLCTALMIGIIALSAYTSIKSANEDMTIVSTQKPTTNTENKDLENTDKGEGDKNEKPSDDDSQVTTTPETIIFDLPFEKASISKEYADNKLIYDSTTKYWCTHQALDFSCTEGQKVKAIYDGKVTKVENSMMNGTVIYLKVSDNLTVVYKGLSANVSVKEGDSVKKGQELGSVTTMLSEKADGVHLHLELLKDEKLIDPTEYFSFSK